MGESTSGKNNDPKAVTAAATGGDGPQRLTVDYLKIKLVEAEVLLGYAAEMGIEVDDSVRDGVLQARVGWDGGGLTEKAADDLLTALTTLAKKVKPVTKESLEFCKDEAKARKCIQLYVIVACFVGFIIVVFSLLTFVSTNISGKITADISTANDLVAKLRVELGPAPENQATNNDASPESNTNNVVWKDFKWFGPEGVPAGLSDKDIVTDLQQFAATMREIDGYTRQLKRCVLDFSGSRYSGTNQSAMELSPGLNVRLAGELTDKAAEYQRVRNIGNQVVERVTVYYGAIAISILPVLYALLGAVAYLLRLYEEQFKNRVLVGNDKHVARLLIAGIGGLVVGQFNNVTTGITVSPFAAAFLVGYGVDVFFAFLEGSLKTFRSGPGGAQAGGN